MDLAKYLEALNQQNIFNLRTAVERLRAGIFDHLAVRLLTVHEEKLSRTVDKGFQSIRAGTAPHLCIRGSYGQGKSHSLFFAGEKALKENFVTSTVNLDLRELPLHNIRLVYGHLIRNIKFPDGSHTLASYWKKWVKERILPPQPPHPPHPNDASDLIPAEVPHLFRSVLVALAQKNISLSGRQRQMKKYSSFRPAEIPYSLERALCGDIIPAVRLRNALKYREVSFYKEHPLSFQGTDLYTDMIHGLSQLFRKMGFQGWVILFDEGESISQVRISARSLSYRILDTFFSQKKSSSGLYPIFAFTDDFFTRVEEEEYDRITIRKGEEVPCFHKNYFEAWKNLTTYTLQDLTGSEWSGLAEKLLHLYMKAYRWNAEVEEILPQLKARSAKLSGEETRYIFKALIEHLDVLAF